MKYRLYYTIFIQNNKDLRHDNKTDYPSVKKNDIMMASGFMLPCRENSLLIVFSSSLVQYGPV
jgi:hypothetical protein